MRRFIIKMLDNYSDYFLSGVAALVIIPAIIIMLPFALIGIGIRKMLKLEQKQ